MSGLELRRHPVLGVTAGVLVVAADQTTKWVSETTWSIRPLTVIPGWLWFTFTENPGAAFSFFQDAGSLLGVAATVASVVVLIALRSPRPRIEAFAFGLILGGALGNLVDRATRGDAFLDGHVVDWIQVPNFPVFNLADSSITVAVILLLLSTWRRVEPETGEAAPGQIPEPSHPVE